MDLAFHCKIVDLFFVRAVLPSLPNPLATGGPANIWLYKALCISGRSM